MKAHILKFKINFFAFGITSKTKIRHVRHIRETDAGFIFILIFIIFTLKSIFSELY